MAYKTGWMKKIINNVSTKVFAYAHVKTVFKDYSNGITLDDVLIETEDFDQTAVTESDISPVILSKLNSLQSTQSDNFTLLNENKAEAAQTYTKSEVDNAIGSLSDGLTNLNNTVTDLQGTTLTGTLAAGDTQLVLNDENITTDSTVEIYTDVYGVSPKNVTVQDGQITLEFKAQETNVNVKVVIK